MKPILITPPAAAPVLLSEVRDTAKGVPEDDALLQGYLKAAVAHLDGYSGILGRCMVTQTWRQDFLCWAPCLRLPFPDVSSVVVKYLDADGAQQVVGDALYELRSGHLGDEVVFRPAFSPPALDDTVAAPVHVELTAGYGAPADVPDDLKVVIMALVSHWYDGLDGEPPHVSLLANRRMRRI